MVRFDPPGFALESYDVIGGWRDFYRGTEGQKAPDFVRSFRSYLTPDEEFRNHVSLRDGQPVDASRSMPAVNLLTAESSGHCANTRHCLTAK